MFRLTKWYLDCHSTEGDAAILYWARVDYGPLRLRYGAALLKLQSGPAGSSYTLRPGGPPRLSPGSGGRWSCPRLGAEVNWKSRARPFGATLLEEAAGVVEWKCLSSRAEVSTRVGERRVSGPGYVERLTLTLPPWRLPFDRLRWGRFLAPEVDWVWIDWSGALDASWLFVDGAERPVGSVSVDKVVDGNGENLVLAPGEVLRQGTLRSTGLRPLRWLAAWVPRWRSARETKWISRGRLARPSGTVEGWAIHEEVSWA